MNLHRIEKQPEWANIPTENQNFWQRTAAKTSEVIAPANAVTLAGFGLVASGLHDMYYGRRKSGFTKIAIGRFADLADGVVAHRTGTKSPLGEALDAGLDKVAMLAALPVLVKSGEVSALAATAMTAKDIAIAGISAAAKNARKMFTLAAMVSTPHLPSGLC